MGEFREQVLEEWSIDLREEFGEVEGLQKFARIMAYSVECDVRFIHIKEPS